MNSVTVVGNLTKDPELFYSKNDKAYCKFTIAENDFRREETMFMNCVAFGVQAENYDEYLRKGDMVTAIGRLVPNVYEDDYGDEQRYKSMVVNDLKFPSNNNNRKKKKSKKKKKSRSGGRRKKKSSKKSRKKKVQADEVDEVLDNVDSELEDEWDNPPF